MLAKDIISAVYSTRFTADEMHQLIDAVKHARTRTQESAVDTMRVGSKVTFIGRGCRVTGVVTKLNRTTVSVREDGSSRMWKCSPSLLNVVG